MCPSLATYKEKATVGPLSWVIERRKLKGIIWGGGFSLDIVGFVPDAEGWLPYTRSGAPQER